MVCLDIRCVRRAQRILSFFAATALIFGQPPSLLMKGVTASADGQSGVFLSDVAPNGVLEHDYGVDVYSYGPSGLRRITNFGIPSYAGTGAFALFPDGTHLAVTTANGVMIIDAATGQGPTIAAPGVGSQVRVSPDGQTILFTIAPNTGHPWSWFPFLWSVPAKGGTAVRLGRGAVDGRHVFAGDGTIVFSSPGPTDDAFATSAPRNVYTVTPDGSIHQLTSFTDTAAQRVDASGANITPDGSRILFRTDQLTYDGSNGSSSPISSTIWVMGRDGTIVRSLPIGDQVSYMTFSADGSLAAWSRNGKLHVQNLDTGEDRVVANLTQSGITEMDFTPDNSRVYFLIGGGFYQNTGALWSVELASRKMQQLYGPRTLLGIAFGATPGGFVTAYSSNLTRDGVIGASGFPLPNSLNGVSLLINGRPAPIVSVAPWQITAQMPMDFPIDMSGLTACYCANASVTLSFDDGTSTPGFPTVVFAADPHVVGSVVYHAATETPVDQGHPAYPGELLKLYATGMGVTNPLVAAGQPAPASPLATLAYDPYVTVGNELLKPSWAGLVPGSIGVYEMDFRLPGQMPVGRFELGLGTKGGGILGQAYVTVAQRTHRRTR